MAATDPLARYGCSPYWRELAHQLDPEAALELGRVMAQHRNQFEVVTAGGVVRGRGAGRLHQRKFERTALPAVGDWVLVQRPANSELWSIAHVVPRRSQIIRRAAGESDRLQLVAANVDVVLIVLAADDPRARERLPRLLALVDASGAHAQVIWNKVDLLTSEQRAQLSPTQGTLHLSARTGEGLTQLRQLAGPGITLAMLGASGAGKSSLINAWLGVELQRTQIVDGDARGRHTTTTRELIATAEGAVLLDTPGMRELGLWAGDTALSDSFPEIDALAQRCRFRDCQHAAEPGCAVREALERGEVERGRLQRWQSLQAELHALRDPQRAAVHRRSRERKQVAPLARRWRA